MFINRLRKTASGSISKKGSKIASVKNSKRINGRGLDNDIFETTLLRPSEILRNIKVVKSRMPKKYIAFE